MKKSIFTLLLILFAFSGLLISQPVDLGVTGNLTVNQDLDVSGTTFLGGNEMYFGHFSDVTDVPGVISTYVDGGAGTFKMRVLTTRS